METLITPEASATRTKTGDSPTWIVTFSADHIVVPVTTGLPSPLTLRAPFTLVNCGVMRSPSTATGELHQHPPLNRGGVKQIGDLKHSRGVCDKNQNWGFANLDRDLLCRPHRGHCHHWAPFTLDLEGSLHPRQ